MNYDKKAYKFGPFYGGESTGFHRNMISVVVFSYSESLKSILVEYVATEMVFLDDYTDADPNHKSISGKWYYYIYFARYPMYNFQSNISC